jgi:hypothetical protein
MSEPDKHSQSNCAAGSIPTFLVTTALEDFWDASRCLLYLGGWCRRFTRHEHWQKLPGQVLESPWISFEARLEAMRTCNSVSSRPIRSIGTPAAEK